MNFNSFFNTLTNFFVIVFNNKKIFIFWFFLYIVGLLLIYNYKINHYQYELEYKIHKQYTPMDRIFKRGTDPLAYNLIKKDLDKYDVYWIDNPDKRYLKLKFVIVENSKNKVDDIVQGINLEFEKYKDEIIKLTNKLNERLDEDIIEIKKEINRNYVEKVKLYEYIYIKQFHNELFLTDYSEIFIQNNYKYENITNAKVKIIIQVFSSYILILYLLNLLFLIYLKYYRENQSF